MDSIFFSFTMPEPDSTMAVADENALLNAEIRSIAYDGPDQLWISLHTADPGSGGADELTGGNYGRQPIAFSDPASGQSANTTEIIFSGLPESVIKGVALWSQAAGGVPRQWRTLTSYVAVSSGGNFMFPVGAVIYNVKGE